MTRTLLTVIADEVTQIFEPLSGAVEDRYWSDRLLPQLGLDPDNPDTAGIVDAFSDVLALRSRISDVAANPSSSESVSLMLEAAGDAFESMRSLSDSPAGDLPGLGQDLLELLMGAHFASKYPLLYNFAVLLLLIDRAELTTPTLAVLDEETVLRAPVVVPRFHLERLIPLLRDPVSVLRAEYVNELTTVEDSEAMADKLFPRLSAILAHLGIDSFYGLRAADRELLGDAAGLVDHSLHVYVKSASGPSQEDAGFTLSLSSAAQGDLGLVISPFGGLTFTIEGTRWTSSFAVDAEVEAIAYGRGGFVVAASDATPSFNANFSAVAAEVGDQPPFVFGPPNGSRLELGGARFDAAIAFSSEESGVALGWEVSKSKIVVAAGDGDGFLASILPSDGLTANFDLGVLWSSDGGLTFKGAAGLEMDIPVGVSLAGVTLVSVHIGLSVRDEELKGEASVTAKASIGPFTALVDRLGAEAILTFPEEGGSLGVADLEVRFKPPSGIGLIIDTGGVVKGGGFLRFDPERGEYAGALELTCANLSLKAIVILSTKVDGAPFALLAMVYARFPGGIELGMRFTLNAVGGMIGIHRGFDYQALVAALPSGALDDILFPENPVADAPRIFASLAAICPIQPGAYTLALMAELGWGSDYICSLRLGVVLPLNDMRKVYLIGQVRVECFRHLPENIRLQLICDTLGEIGFDPFSLRIDGRLRDSRFGPIGIEGQLVLMLTTGSDPRFVIAAGGFHPNFKSIPAGLPARIDRLAVSYKVGKLKAWMKGYFAVAAGTLQFGAEVGCTYKSGSLGFSGDLGIDALIHLSPFMFEADARFNVAVEYRGHELFGVHVKATLWGPDQWRIKGHGSFSILFWDVGIDFDESWGDDVLPAAEPVVLLQKAAEDLANDTYWQFEVPASGGAIQFSAAPVAEAGNAVHPLATLSYRQRRFPFGLALDRLGSAPISGEHSIPVPVCTDHAGGIVPGTPALEPFAVGEYVDLPDEARLTRPSFEPLPAGVSAGISGYRVPETGAVEEVKLDFEQFFLPRKTKFNRGLDLADLHSDLIRHLVAGEAAGSSAVRASSKLARSREPVRSEPPIWTAADPLKLESTAAPIPTWAGRSPTVVAEVGRADKLLPVEMFELAA